MILIFELVILVTLIYKNVNSFLGISHQCSDGQLSFSNEEYSYFFNIFSYSKLEEDLWRLLWVNMAITSSRMSPNGPQQVADPEAGQPAEEKLMLPSAVTDLSGFHMTNKPMSQFLLFLWDFTWLGSEMPQRKTFPSFIRVCWQYATVIYFEGAGYFQTTAERLCFFLNLRG